MKEMELLDPEEAEVRGKRTKTKGILKNPGERQNRKQRKHSSDHQKHVEISTETHSERKHRHRKHRESSNIYDTPKISSVKWKEDLTAAYERSRSGRKEKTVAAVNTSILSGEDELSYYENLVFKDSRKEEQLYDIPRPSNTEAIYINQNFEDDFQTYDRPRGGGPKEDITEEDHIEFDYDVPKSRDGILTPIEEEQSQYDIPRGPRRLEDEVGDENIYENQKYIQVESEPIYMNELNDDRSSGYRSSPSLNSEENLGSQPSTPESGDIFGSREDFFKMGANLKSIHSRFSGHHEEPVSQRHDVAIDTSNTLERQYQEANKERARTKKIQDRRYTLTNDDSSKSIQIEFEEFDPEDSLKRRQYAAEKKLKEKAFKKDENTKNKNAREVKSSILERFNTLKTETRRPDLSPCRASDQETSSSKTAKEKVETIKKKFEPTEVQVKKESSNKKVTKDAKDRDRSVDVYHETVRQRTVREKQQITAELFTSRSVESITAVFPTRTIEKAPELFPTRPVESAPELFTTRPSEILPCSRPTVSKSENKSGAVNDKAGLPSVKKLLARFEPGHSTLTCETVNKPSRTSKEERIIKRGMSAENIFDKKGVDANQPVEPLQSPPLVCHSGKPDGLATKPVNHKWDPQVFVRSLYNLPALEEPTYREEDGPVSLDGSQSCPSIEGYMEKLPAGRKRPTLWNSWKKLYFVARSGVLNIYTSKSQAELVETLELFGGQVDFMDSNMLGLEDRRGQYVVVRCASHKATQEWESALSFHTLESFSKTFISPLPIPKEIKVMSNIIVVDLGGASIRAGICGPNPYLPMLFFPSLMAVNPDNLHEKYFGFDALRPEIRAKFNIFSPLLPSKNIDKYSVDLVALCGLLLKVFQDLRVDPKTSELQLSVPRNFNDKTKIAIAALLFDEFEVRSVNMGNQSTFTLHSYNTDTGIVVDIGERMEVVPIVSGYKVQSGLSRTAVGGMELCSHMRHALLGRNYSLTSFLDTFMVRQVVERLCYMARNFDVEYDTYKGEEKSVSLSEGAKIPSVTLGTERFQITEGLFKPEMWGLDQAGVHVLVKKAISECSLDVRKLVSQSIFLSGGLTLIPGFKHRLEAELSKILPTRPRVHASPYRYHAAFLGACAHAVSPAYATTKIERSQWNQGKVDVANTWIL